MFRIKNRFNIMLKMLEISLFSASVAELKVRNKEENEFSNRTMLTIIFDVISFSKVSKPRRNSVPVFFRHQRIIYFGNPKFKIYSWTLNIKYIERIYEKSSFQFFNGFYSILQHFIIRKWRIRHLINSFDIFNI